jgi:hypothetical protein
VLAEPCPESGQLHASSSLVRWPCTRARAESGARPCQLKDKKQKRAMPRGATVHGKIENGVSVRARSIVRSSSSDFLPLHGSIDQFLSSSTIDGFKKCPFVF